ncbi:MAG TPA: type II toxin-antitoxin system HicB family antitoxin [Candidatus Hydrogenedentes bacterium]|nr:type II toxin-antitoxin system HicB family antitoxin [Candidatus Hydrogenedentota bacterium]HPG68871.1 type II toxin-antitoxin system HicB family antitoxin [Candidatus Hydrogenedentota bacterium]
MPTLDYIYYQEDDMWIGWLEEFPDYRTQGETLEELEENLRDIRQELTSGAIPSVRRAGKLTIR